MTKHLGRAARVFSLLLVTTPAVHGDKVLELKAANYDPVAAVWSDSSGNGNDATALVSAPALTPGQTPNGSAVVTFDGTNSLTLQPGITANGFTCFAYVRPNPGDSRTIVGGLPAASNTGLGATASATSRKSCDETRSGSRRALRRFPPRVSRSSALPTGPAAHSGSLKRTTG